MQRDDAQSAVVVPRERQDTGHGASAGAAADGEESHLDVGALLCVFSSLQQLDEIGGLGVGAEDADGLDGGGAHTGIRIIGAAHDDRQGAVNVPLPGQEDKDLAVLSRRGGEAGQEVGVHFISGQPREGGQGGLRQVGIGIGGDLQQHRQAGGVAHGGRARPRR